MPEKICSAADPGQAKSGLSAVGMCFRENAGHQIVKVFGKVCTPQHPVGACMVSNEGTCYRIFYVRKLMSALMDCEI